MAERDRSSRRDRCARRSSDPTLLVARRGAAPLRRAGPPAQRGALPPARPAGRRPAYLAGDWTFAGDVRRALALRPPLRPARRRGLDLRVRLDRPPRLLAGPRPAPHPASATASASPWAAGAAVEPLARQQPGADRRRVDPRHLRGEDRRLRLLPRRAARDQLASASRSRSRCSASPSASIPRSACGARGAPGSRCSRCRETRTPTLRWCWLAVALRDPRHRRRARPRSASATPRSSGSSCSRRSRTTPIRSSAATRSSAGRSRCTSSTLAAMFAFNLWAYRRSSARPDPAVLRRVPDRGRGAVRARVRRAHAPLLGLPAAHAAAVVPADRPARLLLPGVPARARRAARRGREPAAAPAALADAAARHRRHRPDRARPHRPAARRAPPDPPQLESWTTDRRHRRRVRLDPPRTLPKTTTLHLPVDRQDAFERAERPQVANWQAIPYDRLPRVEAAHRPARRRRAVLRRAGLARRPRRPPRPRTTAHRRADRRDRAAVRRDLLRHARRATRSSSCTRRRRPRSTRSRPV